MKRVLNPLLLIAMMLPLVTGSCTKDETGDPVSFKTDLTHFKNTAKAVVHSSAVGIGEVLKTIPDSTGKVGTIRIYIDSIRFYDDYSGYFYVYNYQCVNIAHATQKNLQGQDLYNYQDCKGKYVIRELSAAAAQGGGFVEFYWIKPGSTGEKLKIGYVEPIPGTNFFIGSGVYVPE
ncbi:MAG: C50 carotenoid epsilon cyclase [Alphaproteobacteria bacterium]|nr:C50 carotenoid epsilon cyclase [Alphaproteobacteria bacterium]